MLQLDRERRVLVTDQVLARVPAVHAHQPVEHRLEIAARRIPVHRADDRPRVRQIQPRVQVEVPHQIGLAAAVLLIAVAGPDAQRHRSGDTPVAGADLLAIPDVAEILDVDLPLLRQPIGHAEHQGAGFGVDARAVVLAPVGAGDEEHPKRPILRCACRRCCRSVSCYMLHAPPEDGATHGAMRAAP